MQRLRSAQEALRPHWLRIQSSAQPYWLRMQSRIQPHRLRIQSQIAPYIRKAAKRNYLSVAMLVIGVLLLGYVASEYWGMYHRQQQLAAQWEQQASAANVPGKASLSAEDLLTRVVIPKISLDAIVVEGASRRDLSDGPGHMKKTAQPGETEILLSPRIAIRFSGISMNLARAMTFWSGAPVRCTSTRLRERRS